jgi:hypothetical protein
MKKFKFEKGDQVKYRNRIGKIVERGYCKCGCGLKIYNLKLHKKFIIACEGELIRVKNSNIIFIQKEE